MSLPRRLSELSEAHFSHDQKEVYDALVSGPRGSIVGPFHVWLRRPELARLADKFGKYCRFGATVDRQVAELAIMQVAAHTGADFEWEHHYSYAVAAGLKPQQLAALKAGSTPHGLAPLTAAAHAVVAEMLTKHSMSTETHRAAVEALGEELLIDLVGVVGYYMFVSLTINVFDV